MVDPSTSAQANAEAVRAEGEPRDQVPGERQTSDAELEKVRHLLQEERQKRAAAETVAVSERSNRFAAQEQAIANGTEAAKARLAEAKRAYAAAMHGGKFEDAAEHQEQISQTALELRGLRWQQAQIEQTKQRLAAPADDESRFEAALAQLPRPAQEWCRRHPDYVTDAHKNARAHAAHFAAVAEGLSEWSPAYWDFVEGRLGLRGGGEGERDPAGDGFEDLDYEAAAPRAPERRTQETRDAMRRASATTAAPPSRGATTGIGEPRRRTRQPTAGELEAAKISFPDEWKESPKKALALYFENQAALRREGRLT
jgi:hypothetical protein